eukprot:scaffold15141_cov101-Isochrysis_galbana.AAC.6
MCEHHTRLRQLGDELRSCRGGTERLSRPFHIRHAVQRAGCIGSSHGNRRSFSAQSCRENGGFVSACLDGRVATLGV